MAFKHNNPLQRSTFVSDNDDERDSDQFHFATLLPASRNSGSGHDDHDDHDDHDGHHQPAPTGTVYGGLIPDSGNPMLEALLASGKWDNSRPISYFFDDADSNIAWTAAEKTMFRAALQSWADVANIKFVETSDINSANFVEIKYAGGATGPTSSGFPNSSNQIVMHFNDSVAWNADTIRPGGLFFSTFVHEIGHSLGLAHPHDTGSGSSVFPNVDNKFYDYGDNDLNQTIYTIMSYNDGYKSLFGTTTDLQFESGKASTPMPFDIAAVQFIYGANPHHNAGNNTYFLPTSNEPGTSWIGIYDTGGIDTIVNPGDAPSTISLVSATIDNSPTGGSSPSYVANVNGGYTIAQNVIIENATGGSSSDAIIGNHVDNVLEGKAGDDLLYGAGGNDTLLGGAGDDTLYGDAGPARTSGVGLGSGLIVNPSGNTSFATALDVTNSFSLAANPDIANSTTTPHVTVSVTTPATGSVSEPWFAVTVKPGSTITVDIDHTTNIDSFILVYGPDGRGLTFNDDSTVDPGSPFAYTFHRLPYSQDSAASINAVEGGTYYLQISSFGAFTNNQSLDINISVSDPITLGTDGAAGNDFVSGGAGDDRLFGGDGRDVLSGGTGNDILDGGRGNDFLWGDSGLDTFVFQPGSGHDTVMDFDIGHGANHDVLDLSAFGLSIADVLHDTTNTAHGALITIGADEILLADVSKAQLAAHLDHFLV